MEVFKQLGATWEEKAGLVTLLYLSGLPVVPGTVYAQYHRSGWNPTHKAVLEDWDFGKPIWYN